MWMLPLAAGPVKRGSHCTGSAGPGLVVGDHRSERFCEKLPAVPGQGWACQGFTGITELGWGKPQTCALAVGERKSSAVPKVVFSVPCPGKEGSDRVALEGTWCHQGHPPRHCQGSTFGFPVCQAVLLVEALEWLMISGCCFLKELEMVGNELLKCCVMCVTLFKRVLEYQLFEEVSTVHIKMMPFQSSELLLKCYNKKVIPSQTHYQLMQTQDFFQKPFHSLVLRARKQCRGCSLLPVSSCVTQCSWRRAARWGWGSN